MAHLMNTGTFRIFFVHKESKVLVKVVKVKHALGIVMLHRCRYAVNAPSYYFRKTIDPSHQSCTLQNQGYKTSVKGRVEWCGALIV
jgi:hypothetical protein